MSPEDLLKAEQLTRRVGAANCWTGTTGSLAAMTLTLIREARGKTMERQNDSESTPGEQLLRDALSAIADRRQKYGPPREHFARTVGAINAIFAHKLREPFAVTDWPIIMALDKCARDQGPAKHPDNPVDVVGYMACLADCEASVSRDATSA